MAEEQRDAEPAPEGSQCAEHTDRAALVTCPRCGSYCCLACWQNAAGRCHACLLQDPLPPVPWADPALSWPRRLFGTLYDALRPTSSAPRFARGRWTQGLSFALLTALPLALLSGVIPFTHFLLFGGRFSVTVTGDPTGGQLALDLTQAMGFGLLLFLVKLLALTVPFASLVRAYESKRLESEPARQVMLYRAWLLPLGGRGGLLLGLVLWSLPVGPEEGLGESVIWMLEAVSLLPLLVLLWSMTAAARIAGAGPIASTVVVVVPFLAMMFAEPILLETLSPWLPDSQSVREAAEAAGALTNPYQP